MQNFSLQEIQERQAYHQRMADRFTELYNAKIKSCVLVLVTEDNTVLAPVEVKIKPIEDLKAFIYEMSVYHVNERIKWDITLSNQTQPNA